MGFDENRPVAVVTGASAGIGRATARRLAGLGWQVIGVGRDPERSAAAEAEIAAAGRVAMLRSDFTLMADVRRTAEEIRALTPRVDVLINNAGGVRDRQIITAEGTEATFAANHLAPFLLTQELMPQLRASAAGTAPGSTRVIAVSSSAHRQVDGLDPVDLQSLGDVSSMVAYCRAKLANILFTRELARRAGPDGIVAQVMHPGLVASNFAAHGSPALQAHYANAADALAPEEPAETLVWLATEPEGGRDGGRHFHRMAEEPPSDAAQDDDAAARLWVESEKLLAALQP
ncbi:SDR family NAD(P)-dependent oxidoreductase [Pseudonocardia parietis]|uniref:NAD(P)-dependent dehydrogenase (Short-subunit alcohol dehydrogenase family) n=1 Tax=Pseudonocardia parietis TaxID=570936 RepID=A0ABS4VX80_9PSEU|nr:SDR family NAD(P)-dependent oxidoreductase [Pseudonocardia parietis]MBP2368545.1 NAD(P)-dependent dehydrogenase (short-subunit alcohol dehydrogenase family) [Pseudonocardia parietis]